MIIYKRVNGGGKVPGLRYVHDLWDSVGGMDGWKRKTHAMMRGMGMGMEMGDADAVGYIVISR
jgi:hypothetical protein